MRTGLKAIWLIKALGMTINQAAGSLGIARSNLDNWKSKEDSAPGIKIILKLTEIARSKGIPLTVEWFYDEADPVLPSVVSDNGSEYVVHSSAESVRVACSLTMILHGTLKVAQVNDPTNLSEFQPLISFAVRELESLRLLPNLNAHDANKLEGAISLLSSLETKP